MKVVKIINSSSDLAKKDSYKCVLDDKSVIIDNSGMCIVKPVPDEFTHYDAWYWHYKHGSVKISRKVLKPASHKNIALEQLESVMFSLADAFVEPDADVALTPRDMFVSRNAVNIIGYFNVSLSEPYDNIDYANRAILAGLKVVGHEYTPIGKDYLVSELYERLRYTSVGANGRDGIGLPLDIKGYALVAENS